MTSHVCPLRFRGIFSINFSGKWAFVLFVTFSSRTAFLRSKTTQWCTNLPNSQSFIYLVICVWASLVRLSMPGTQSDRMLSLSRDSGFLLQQNRTCEVVLVNSDEIQHTLKWPWPQKRLLGQIDVLSVRACDFWKSVSWLCLPTEQECPRERSLEIFNTPYDFAVAHVSRCRALSWGAEARIPIVLCNQAFWAQNYAREIGFICVFVYV